MSAFIESIVLGALSTGVNKPTFFFVNVSLSVCIALLLGAISSGSFPIDVTLHLVVLCCLSFSLLFAFNWVVSGLGFVPLEKQKGELGLIVDDKIRRVGVESMNGSAKMSRTTNSDTSIDGANIDGGHETLKKLKRQKEFLSAHTLYGILQRQYGSTRDDARGTAVAVGISGGVDSAVAAHMLQKQGYDVTGFFMRNWDEAEETGNDNCTIEADFRSATAVCKHLGIPLMELDFISTYWDSVFRNFLHDISQGTTPNPDLECNKQIKFSAFMNAVAEKGFNRIATGHYARTVRCCPGSILATENLSPDYNIDEFPSREDEVLNNTTMYASEDERVLLLKGIDQDKDQTYFLASIDPSILDRVLFPLGHLHKSQVRDIAMAEGIPTAQRKSSTGICFIGKRNFDEFLCQYIEPIPGTFLDVDTGKILGHCENILTPTYGQRPGIGGLHEKSYIVGKDISTKVVYVAVGSHHSALYSSSAVLGTIHWLSPWHAFRFQQKGTLRCEYKARYRQPPGRCNILDIHGQEGWTNDFMKNPLWNINTSDSPPSVYVEFQEPSYAITPQQALVLYDGDICLGYALIKYPCR